MSKQNTRIKSNYRNSYHELTELGKRKYDMIFGWFLFIVAILATTYQTNQDSFDKSGGVLGFVFASFESVMVYKLYATGMSLRTRENVTYLIPIEPNKQIAYIWINYFLDLGKVLLFLIPVDLVIFFSSGKQNYLDSLIHLFKQDNGSYVISIVVYLLLITVLLFPLMLIQRKWAWGLYALGMIAVQILGVKMVSFLPLAANVNHVDIISYIQYMNHPWMGTAILILVLLLVTIIEINFTLWIRSPRKEIACTNDSSIVK